MSKYSLFGKVQNCTFENFLNKKLKKISLRISKDDLNFAHF